MARQNRLLISQEEFGDQTIVAAVVAALKRGVK